MFFIRAPEAGTGKTYLVTVIYAISTGRRAPALIGTPNKEEMEKRLTAAAVEAKPIINLNNLTFDIESEMISSDGDGWHCRNPSPSARMSKRSPAIVPGSQCSLTAAISGLWATWYAGR